MITAGRIDCSPRLTRSVAEAVTSVGGKTLDGRPLFRVVWGWNRREISGGRWEQGPDVDLAFVGYRIIPKYDPADRWHIEMYRPPEFYGSPTQWEKNTVQIIDGQRIATMGSFPSSGDYEHVLSLDPYGEFVEPSPSLCEKLVGIFVTGMRADETARRQALYDRERKTDKAGKAIVNDMLDDAFPVRYGAPWVSGSWRGNRNDRTTH